MHPLNEILQMSNLSKTVAQRYEAFSKIVSEFRVRRLFVLLLYFVPVVGYMILHVWYLQHRLSNSWRDLSGIIAFSLLGITIAWLTYRHQRWQANLARNLGIECPHCHQLLLNHSARKAAYQGHCVFCGKGLEGANQ